MKIGLRNSYDYLENKQSSIRSIFLGFDRFTGYFPHAYEASKRLGFKRVPYKDEQQSFYNRGRVFLGTELAGIPGMSLTFTVNDNDKLDIQNLIHSISGYPWHTTTHKSSMGIDVFYNYQGLIGQQK